MGQLIDFTRYNQDIKWTLSNGWNIYIWNRMLQNQERKIADEERKLLSPETAFPFIPGAPKLNPARIGMPIDPEPDHVDDAFIYTTDHAREIADRLRSKLPSEQVQFLSTPLGDNYFYDHYIQCLNQEEQDDTFNWKPKGDGRLSVDGKDVEEVTDFQFGNNITTEFGDLTFIPHDNVTRYHGLPEIPVGKGNGAGLDAGYKKTGYNSGCRYNSGYNSGGPQHNSKESSQQENSCRSNNKPGKEN